MSDNAITMKVDKVAALLMCSVKKVLEISGIGVLPAAKIGKCWVFYEIDVVRYLRSEIDRQTKMRLNRYRSELEIQAAEKPVKGKISRSRSIEPPDLTPYLKGRK